MPNPREQDPVVLVCVFNDNMAEWLVQHTEETDGELFVGIEFGDDHVKLTMESGREITIPEEIYANFGEPLSCDTHMIREVDPRGSFGREYSITAPVVTAAPAFRG